MRRDSGSHYLHYVNFASFGHKCRRCPYGRPRTGAVFSRSHPAVEQPAWGNSAPPLTPIARKVMRSMRLFAADAMPTIRVQSS